MEGTSTSIKVQIVAQERVSRCEGRSGWIAQVTLGLLSHGPPHGLDLDQSYEILRKVVLVDDCILRMEVPMNNCGILTIKGGDC